MKKFLLAGVALTALLGGSASAADLAVRRPLPPPVPVFSWTGCYIGGHGGYGMAQSSHRVQFDDVTNVFSDAEQLFTDNFNNRGGVWGLQAGCNVQFGKAVIGIEGDYSWTRLKDSVSFAEPFVTPPVDTAFFESNVKGLASIRGRAGIAEGPMLLYVTAGAAWARFDYTFILNDIDEGTHARTLSFNPNGIVFGAGAEWMLWNNLILRAEYLHYTFGNRYSLPTNIGSTVAGTEGIGPGLNDFVTLKNADVIRVGLSYMFNFGRGVMAAY